ncbi:MAG: SDR family NAD(P)-dependent oxidoreductase [Pseudomonadota bacterium]
MEQKPTTLITGAGKRIGALIARHLAARGHDLVLHYHRSGEAAQALAVELRAMREAPQVTLVQANLEDTAALGALWAGLPPCTAIIHNASHYVRDRLADMTPASLRAHLAVNFEAPLLLTQGFMAQLPTGAAGHVVVLGDGYHGWTISPEFFSYAVSKHAWASVIDLLAAAVAPRARANVIALAPTLQNGDEAALFARLAERAPLQRVSAPDEVLATLDYLLASPGVTGQVLSLAGGVNLATVRPPVSGV